MLLVGALTFVPALALGPVVEHLHARCREVAAGIRHDHAPDTAVRYVRSPALDAARALVDVVQQARPARAVAQPGDVRRLRRQHPDHASCASGAARPGEAPAGFILAITLWLWFTVLFANFAEAMAEGRGKAQAAALRGAQAGHVGQEARRRRSAMRASATVPSTPTLRKGDVVLVEAGDLIPGDGEVIEGVASVDESAITGESAPVIRESRRRLARRSPAARACCPTGSSCASRANPGESFLDRMIAMVEGAKRQKTPNEIALTSCWSALTLVFLLATVTLLPFSIYSVAVAKARARRSRSPCWSRCSSA